MDRGIGDRIEVINASEQGSHTMILFLSGKGTDPFSVVDGPMLAQGKSTLQIEPISVLIVDAMPTIF